MKTQVSNSKKEKTTSIKGSQSKTLSNYFLGILEKKKKGVLLITDIF